MSSASTKRRVYRFGSFELDTGPGELRKNGTRIRLQDQPLQILVLLLEHSGELVSREQIQNSLWAPGTFVDYDNAINSAVRKLREALGDDSGDPRFIETLARRGYRFVGHVEAERTEKVPDPPLEIEPVATKALPQSKRKTSWAAVIGGVLLAVAGSVVWSVLRPNPVIETPLTPVPLTAANGWEASPSFSPDGNQLAYAWDETGKDSRSHIYVKMIGSGRPVGLTRGQVYDFAPAWSPDGRNVAFLRAANRRTGVYSIPALGGTERKLTDGYFSGPVSWSPDGRFLAAAEGNALSNASSLCLLAAESGDKFRLTSPTDSKIRDGYPAFSPDGRTLLFARCSGSYHCSLYLLDLTSDYRSNGQPRMLRQENGGIEGTAWTPDGKEVIYSLSGDAAYDFRLWRVRAEVGAQPRRLSLVGDQTRLPVIAKQGRRLAYYA